MLSPRGSSVEYRTPSLGKSTSVSFEYSLLSPKTQIGVRSLYLVIVYFSEIAEHAHGAISAMDL